MIIEPNVIVLYVENLEISSKFYQNLFGIKPEEAVEPAFDNNGAGELAFTPDNNKKVDELFIT